MLVDLALARAETQEGPPGAGVAGRCSTLHHSASHKCRRTLKGGGLDSKAARPYDRLHHAAATAIK